MSQHLPAIERFAGLRGPRAGYALLGLDLAALGWVILASFLPSSLFVRIIDVIFGIALGTELVMRLRAARQPWRELLRPAGVAEIIAVVSFLLVPFGEAWGFLRVLRTLRLLRTSRLLADLRVSRTNPEAPIALADLVVFLVVMTGLIHATQHQTNPHITNWADALYFTVTALTTTGFGDITLQGTSGRMLSVIVMLAGVTLFLRLAQALFRPVKVMHRCPNCGLGRHDPDAVHCKACGVVINIPNDE
jgi:voltage-gated potassium channel